MADNSATKIKTEHLFYTHIVSHSKKAKQGEHEKFEKYFVSHLTSFSYA